MRADDTVSSDRNQRRHLRVPARAGEHNQSTPASSRFHARIQSSNGPVFTSTNTLSRVFASVARVRIRRACSHPSRVFASVARVRIRRACSHPSRVFASVAVGTAFHGRSKIQIWSYSCERGPIGVVRVTSRTRTLSLNFDFVFARNGSCCWGGAVAPGAAPSRRVPRRRAGCRAVAPGAARGLQRVNS
jgi:hypothetical protein